MRALAAYIMRGQIQAAGIVGLFGVLAWIFPLLSYISNAALALVVLRRGPKAGVIVMAGAALLAGTVAQVRFGSPLLAIMMVMALWIPVWLAAQVLSTTRSQTMLLLVASLIAVIFAIGMRVIIGDVEAFWQNALNKLLSQAGSSDIESQTIVIDKVAAVMNGFIAAGLGLSIVLSVILARWWQAQLYNPGGFGAEFRHIQLPKVVAIATISIVLLTTISKGQITFTAYLIDLGLIGVMAFMFHGLAIVHYFAQQTNVTTAWLAGLYFFIFLASIYAFIILAIIGVADSIADFRKQQKGSA